MNKKSLLCIAAAMAMLVSAGCATKPAQQMPRETTVKAMKVIKQDAPISYEFVGEVVAKDEVQIQSRVSGNIVRKLVKGGDTVTAGQPLFEIDSRPYAAAVADSQAQVAQARASLSSVNRDVARYSQLAAQGGIPMQVYDNTKSQAEQVQAQVSAIEARLTRAQDDLADTVIVSPVSGKIGVGELSVGRFVQPGSTVLATVSSVNPVQVRFSMSENEYLKFARMGNTPDAWGQNLKLMLSDGNTYPLPGVLEQVDRGLAGQTGTLTMKASFDNPNQLLVPGMFARIVATGETRSGALLVPQRTIQEMLGKTFVTIVNAENKSEMRPVKLGPKVGVMQIIEDGLQPDDLVIVEGFAKIPPNSPVKVTMMTPEELAIPVAK